MLSGYLPDEIIREILFPALRVPDEVFRSSEAVSPFSNYSESTSAFLVVCKSWLRVATPLLYNVVVLRSKPQAQALERALQGNSLLGTFIQKLRVEGGLGSPMYNVFRLAPNIAEIWLSLQIWSSDSVSGLCRGLPLANPRRLTLYDQPYRPFKTNAPSRQLMEIVCQCIKKWERLSTVDIPYQTLPWRNPNHVMDLSNALCEAKPLRTITLVEPQFDIPLLRCLARPPSLEAIHIGPRPVREHGDYHKRRSQATKALLMKEERLRTLIHYDYDIDDIGHDEEMACVEGAAPTDQQPKLYSFDSSFVALRSVSDTVKSEIYSNIIFFSLLTTHKKEAFYSGLGITSEHSNKVPKLNILLVSKQFHTMAMRHYYRHCLINGLSQLWRVESHLSDHPPLGSAIRSLITRSCESGAVAEFRPIVSCATNLVHLIYIKHLQDKRTPMLDYKGLTTLAQNVGSTLQTLTGHLIARPTAAKPPTPLYAFVALRSLDWETPTQLKFKREEVPPGALACLENLSFVSVNDTFLQLLGCMTLPALRNVSFPVAKKMPGAHEFLKIHGKKLNTLSAEDVQGFWALCPSLCTVYLSGRPAFDSHAMVEKIVLTKIITRELHVKAELQDLGLLDFGMEYPALKEIQVYTCDWPTTQRDITKSNWVKWAERLMEWGIRLSDQEGKHWRRRLK